MMMEKVNKVKVARLLSIIGHPLLTICVMVYYLSHQELPAKEARIVSSIIIFGVAVPILLHNVWKMKKGAYTNFDVSDQRQRRGFFPFVLFLMTLATFYFWWKDYPPSLILSMAIFLIMVLVFACINIGIKISMHAGINFYIAALLLHYHLAIGIVVLCFSILVALSRWVLKRHSLQEIWMGAAFGFAFGFINSYFL